MSEGSRMTRESPALERPLTGILSTSPMRWTRTSQVGCWHPDLMWDGPNRVYSVENAYQFNLMCSPESTETFVFRGI